VPIPPHPATLSRLRHLVAKADASGAAFPEDEPPLDLGVGAIDAALGGGLARGTLHEVFPVAPIQIGAATGFALALAQQAAAHHGRKQALWIQQDFVATEAGIPHGLGIDLWGFRLGHLLVLRVSRSREALWAMEEALKCRALAAVIAEPADHDTGFDLTATRRLAHAARRGGGIGLLLRQRPQALPSIAMTRWVVASTPGITDPLGGMGRPTFELSLVRNRRGPCGRWIIEWNRDERLFVPATLPGDLAAAARNGSNRAMFARAG